MENVTFYQEGATVFVVYDLIGERARQFDVEVLVSLDGGQTFPIRPRTVIGDVGRGVRAGRDRRIAWTFVKEFPDGLEGTLVFEVRATRQSEERRGGGFVRKVFGVALVGGAAAVLYSLVDRITPGSEPIASPPPRPGN